MEPSASAPALLVSDGPVLNDEDYAIADGLEKRVQQGKFSKDKGTYSSRINQIIRQAAKCPGPGKYVAHEEWDVKNGKKAHVIHEGNKFPNGTRDYKPMHKNPAPCQYEHKDFGMGKSIGGGPHLSRNRRVVYGQMTKGKRRSFLEGAIAQGMRTPAPGHNDIQKAAGRANKLDVQSCPTIAWDKEKKKNKSPKPADVEIGPNHYTIQYHHQEERQPVNTIPKAKSQNFLDKAVKEKYVDIKSKRELPGPGTYNTHDYDDSKYSRGTRYLQLRGMGRSSVSGYF